MSAEAIDADFQFVADNLPDRIKKYAKYSGESFWLAWVEAQIDLGRDISQPEAPGRYIHGFELRARYLGQVTIPDEQWQKRECRRIEITAQAHGDVPGLGFWKVYEVTHGGGMRDMEPTQAEDLEACPVPIELMEHAILSLRDQFAQDQGLPIPETAEVSA